MEEGPGRPGETEEGVRQGVRSRRVGQPGQWEARRPARRSFITSWIPSSRPRHPPGNWPSARSAHRWRMINALAGSSSKDRKAEEQRKLFHDNAVRVYPCRRDEADAHDCSRPPTGRLPLTRSVRRFCCGNDVNCPELSSASIRGLGDDHQRPLRLCPLKGTAERLVLRWRIMRRLRHGCFPGRHGVCFSLLGRSVLPGRSPLSRSLPSATFGPVVDRPSPNFEVGKA